jgi:hypothetical protein
MMMRVPVSRQLMQEIIRKDKIYSGSGHGAVRPAGCASTILSCTEVLVVGDYKLGEKGREAPKFLYVLELIEANANIELK